MNDAEALLTDVVTAIADSIGATFAELESRTKSQNFRSAQGAAAIRTLIQKVPANAQNRDTIIAVYQTFAAALTGKLDGAPEVPLRRSRGSAARKSTQQAREKPTP